MNKTELQELITKASFNKKQQDAVNALLNKIFSLEQEVQSLQGVNKHISESTDPDLLVKFAFPDVHGTLKVLIKEGITPKFQTFNSIIEYYGILNKVGFTDPTAPGYMGEFE